MASRTYAKLIPIQLAEAYDVSTGYQWVELAVDAGEVGSIVPGGKDLATGEEVSEVYVKGMQMYKTSSSKDGSDTVAAKVPGRIAKGNWKDIMEQVNNARP